MELTKQQAEERLEKMKTFLDAEDFVEAFQTFTEPRVFEPLRSLRESVQVIQQLGEDFSTEDNRDHDEAWLGTVASLLPKLEEIERELQERTAEFAVRIVNCKCGACVARRMANAAPNN